MSAAAHKVMEAFANVMGELAVSDTDQWEPAEVIAFADGIESINFVMAQAKRAVIENGTVGG